MNYDIKALQLGLINASFQGMKRAGRMESKLNELMSAAVSEWRKNKYIFTTLKTISNKRTSQWETGGGNPDIEILYKRVPEN